MHGSKCEDLVVLLEYLVKVHVSVSRRDEKKDSVGVGCRENREIRLLSG